MRFRQSERARNTGSAVVCFFRALREITRPVAELGKGVREAIECGENDFAISRPLARNPSTVVDSQAAGLLELFRQPRTIVEAVILFCRRRGLDPEEVLEQAYPRVVPLMRYRYLKFAGNGDSEPKAGPSLSRGDKVDGLMILRPLYLLEDTEPYVVKTGDGSVAALKMPRPEAGPQVEQLFQHEAEVLRFLNGRVAPALLREGWLEERRYLLLEWCRGVDTQTAVLEWSNGNSVENRGHLIRLLVQITCAYAALHELGVVHGDVHPRNVLVDGYLSARLIDLGFARIVEANQGGTNSGFADFSRGGIPFFFEPEYARAVLAGGIPPPVTRAGEQYALAAMLYTLVTGVHYLDFNLEREKMPEQIVEEEPVAFAERQVPAWPKIEGILARSLRKEPRNRFPSLAAVAEEFKRFSPGLGTESTPVGLPPPQSKTALSQAFDRIYLQLGLEAPLFANGISPAPHAYLNFGAAGVAYGLYRIACSLNDPECLALADAWACKAAGMSGKEEGFYSKEFEITPENVGRASPFHSPSGVCAVQALIARAMGNPVSQLSHLESFLAASRNGHQGFDLTLGHSSNLLALSFLLDALPRGDSIAPDPRQKAGNETLETIGKNLSGLPPVQEAEIEYLGIAHGWAGFLYATLQWCRASGAKVPCGLETRLRELAELAEPQGRGLTWPWMLRSEAGAEAAYMPGLCNGSSGYVFLWTLAYRLLENPGFLDLAQGAAWDAWEAPDMAASLCCGLVGRSYALLNFYKTTGESRWLARAQVLARKAAEFGQLKASQPYSLYKGELSLAVLAADLENSESAAFPFFEEEEGW